MDAEPRTLAALEQAMGTLRHEAVTVMAGLRAQGFVIVQEAEARADTGLDALRALSEAATPGPWEPVARAGAYTDMSEAGEMFVIGAAGLKPKGDADTRGIALAKPANAALIVAAVNYVRSRLGEGRE